MSNSVRLIYEMTNFLNDLLKLLGTLAALFVVFVFFVKRPSGLKRAVFLTAATLFVCVLFKDLRDIVSWALQFSLSKSTVVMVSFIFRLVDALVYWDTVKAVGLGIFILSMLVMSHPRRTLVHNRQECLSQHKYWTPVEMKELSSTVMLR